MASLLAWRDRIVYWSLVAIPFTVALGPAIPNILLGFSMASFLVKKIIKKEPLCNRRSMLIALGCMLLVALISFKNTVSVKASVQGIEKMLLAFSMFLIVSNGIVDRRHFKRVVYGIIAGAAFAAFDAVWQMVFGFDFIRHNPPMIFVQTLRRATAGFSHTNMLAIFLTASAPLAVGLARYHCKGVKKLVMSLVAALIVAGVCLTYSRGALAGLFLGSLGIAIFRKDKLVLSLLVVALVAAPFLLPKDVKYFAKCVNYDPVRFMLNDERISIFKNAVNMAKHHPYVGVGVNTFIKNYAKYKVPEPSYAQTSDSMYAHNNFLHMAGEIGLLGVGSFVAFLALLFYYNGVLYRRLRDNFLKVSTLSLAGCVAAFLINGLTETSLYNPKVAIMFWFIAGLCLSAERMVCDDTRA